MQTHLEPRDADSGDKQDEDPWEFRPREDANLAQGFTDDARMALFAAGTWTSPGQQGFLFCLVMNLEHTHSIQAVEWWVNTSKLW